MLLRTAIDVLLSRINSESPSNPDVRCRCAVALNLCSQHLFRAAPWEFRKRSGQLTLIPMYTTGTCAIVQYDGYTNEAVAKTVTFSGASLSTKMVGSYFQPSSSVNWYRIVAVDTVGGTIVVDAPVSEATGGALAFKVWKRFYELPGNVDVVLRVGSWEHGKDLDYKSYNDLMAMEKHKRVGTPTMYTVYGGLENDDTTYSTGTVSGTEGSNILTGITTSFLGRTGSGDLMTVAGNEYTVDRVESDTSMVLRSRLVSTVPAGTTFSVRKNTPAFLMFDPTTDRLKVVQYEFLLSPWNITNEAKDYFPFPDYFMLPMLDRAEMMFREYKDDSKWTALLQLYSSEVSALIERKSRAEPGFMQFAPFIHPNSSGRQ